MLVGHYGPAFALKCAERTIPLWVLFVAVQWMDVLWSGFVALGIERFRVVPGFTATNALDLYYMPFTHSLPGAAALRSFWGRSSRPSIARTAGAFLSSLRSRCSRTGSSI